MVFLTGPAGLHGPRGIAHIKTGFIQTATVTALNGVYGAGGTLTSSLEGRSFNDAGKTPLDDPAPWQHDNIGENMFIGRTSADPPGTVNPGVFFGNTYARLISAGDGPIGECHGPRRSLPYKPAAHR